MRLNSRGVKSLKGLVPAIANLLSLGMASAAKLLREARSRAGLSQRALARRAGTTQSVVARIEAGHRQELAEVLDLFQTLLRSHPQDARDIIQHV